MHEYAFFEEMVKEFLFAGDDNRPSMYSMAFLIQYGARTKRFIDDIFTISLAGQKDDLQFSDIIFISGSKLCTSASREGCGETY